jgi:hypothetical protein
MIYKFQYENQEERNQLIQSNSDKYLIEEQNIIDGNFLIFTDTPRLEDNIQDIKNNTDLILLKQEGII